MPVPLTARHLLYFNTEECSTCHMYTMCVRAEVHIDRVYDSTPNICLECLSKQTPAESIIALVDAGYGRGRRAPTRAMQRTARRREEKLASDIDARKQPASGSMPHAKGDVRRIGEWVGDDKTCRTLNKGFHLTRELVAKVRSWCKRGEKFFIAIGFLEPISQRVLDEVVVIDRHVFEEIVRARFHR